MSSAEKISKNRILQVSLSLFAVIWGILAISPKDRFDWWLENILVFIALAVLVVSYFKFRFSTLSYVLFLALLLMHSYGAHYAYESTPVDAWLKDTFHWKRNIYDRVVHFAYGILMAYPAFEFLRRFAHIRGVWTYVVAVAFIVSTGAIYEVIEMIVAGIVSPKASERFVGLQGDKWDAQKDMSMHMIGSTAAMLATATAQFFKKKRQRTSQ